MSEIVLQAEGVSKKFCKSLKRSLLYGLRDIAAEMANRDRHSSHLRPDEFWALHEVSFQLPRGEALALIGRNGAGKSTMMRLLNGRLKLDAGVIRVRGRVGAMTELGAGFNLLQTGRENIYNAAAVLGIPHSSLGSLLDQIIAFAEIEDFIDSPVQNYSSGMRARLGYAIAAHFKPEILLVDEALAVGDSSFRRRCMKHMADYLTGGGSLVVVAHDLYALQCIAKRCILLEHGRVLFNGSLVDGLSLYYELLRIPPEVPLGPVTASSPQGQEEEPASLSSVPLQTPKTASPMIPEPSARDPVVIEKIAIEPLEGTILQTDKGARVTLAYRSNQDYASVSCGFHIRTADQLVQIASALIGLDGSSVQLKRGSGQFVCTIPRVPLMAGNYALCGGLADRLVGCELAHFGFVNPPLFFSVTSTVSPGNNMRAHYQDLVTLDVHWESVHS